MEPEEIDFEPAPAEPVAHRPSVARSTWRGARTGMRLVAYVALPLSLIMLTLSLAMTAFAGGAGRGWGLSKYSIGAFQVFFALEFLGAFFGAPIGFAGGIARLARPDARTPRWLAVFFRPIGKKGRPDGDGSARSRMPIWPWLVGLPVPVVLGAAFGLGAYAGRMVDRRLADAVEAADIDDPNWRIDDLMAARQLVPDDENSALVVARVVALLPEDWPQGPKPKPGEPEPVATALDAQQGTPRNVRVDDATADRFRRELETYAEALKLARTLADDRYRRGRHELVLGPTLIDTRLPETQASRNAVRLLTMDAGVRAHEGDIDGALDSCRAMIGVGRSIGDEPFMVSGLVKVNEGSYALDLARRALGQGVATDPVLARLQALVLDELDQPLILHGLKGERAVQFELIRRIREGEMPISALSDGGPPYDPSAPPQPISPWGRLMFDHQLAVSLEWTSRMVAIARQPDRARPPLLQAWKAEIDRTRKNQLKLLTTTLPLLLSPAIDAAVTAEMRYHASFGAMAILLAAERHRLKSGDWPDSIEAIDPALLPKPPLDPFSGQLFRVERRDGQFLVYSVGPNGKDEHGEVDKVSWPKQGRDDYGTGAWDPALRRREPPPQAENP